MKATCRALGGRISFEVNAESTKELFAAIGDIQEVFDAESKCGLCGSTDLGLGHRVAKGFDFYEIRCRGCGGQFSFGQRKDGGKLFPKRKDKDGSPLASGGWHKYGVADEDDEESYPPQSSPAPTQQRAPPAAGKMHSAADIPPDAWGDPSPPRSARR